MKSLKFISKSAVILASTLAILFPLFSGCGPNLKGAISLLTTLDETPALAVTIFEKYLYSIDENGKLKVFDLSKPESAKRVSQIDALKAQIYRLFIYNKDRLMVIAKDGKFMLFDLTYLDRPVPLWGKGKVLKLPAIGPFIVRADVSAMYITPMDGSASIVRVDMTPFNKFNASQKDIDNSYKKFGSSGGGGISIMYDHYLNPLRFFVGNKKTGKVDLWMVGDIESGNADKPKASFETKAGTNIEKIFSYKETPKAPKGTLIIYGSNGVLEYFDLGHRFKLVDSPTSIASAEIKNLMLLSLEKKLAVSKQLELYDLSADLKKPELFAIPETRAELDVRQVALYGDQYLISAEANGLNLYKFTRKK